MEDGAVSAPPPALEWAVECLLPAPAREAVIGDLREVYRSPRHYIREALRTVPRIVLGHAWRNANPLLLGLNGFLIWLCLAGLNQNGHALSRGNLARIAIAGLFVLILSQGYHGPGRPTARRAILEAIGADSLILTLCLWNFGLKYERMGSRDYPLELAMLGLLPLVLPVLGLLRTCLVLQSDKQQERLAKCDSLALADDHRAFLDGVRWINLGEGLALFAVAVALPVVAGAGLWLPAIFAATALYLLSQCLMGAAPGDADEASLRRHYRRQLQLRQQLRHFLAWLWAAPFLMAACRCLIWPGCENGRPILVAFGSAAMVSICFLVRAVNSEATGLARERMARLERLASPSGA
jgi:hypothetical protein